MTNYILSYDVASDRLRTKLAQKMLAAGCQRLQKSVFLAPAFKQVELEALRQEVSSLFRRYPHLNSDSLLCWPASDRQLAAMRWLGDQTFFDKLIDPPGFSLH